ncbi:MAG: glycosyltransferase [Acidobacteriota bacterium]|nr:MAG: glycosyltransferase [Acidobacteriota bacterium]
MAIPTKSLYISYFGVREPLVQTQVLPYLRELLKPDEDETAGTVGSSGETARRPGSRIVLLTFEPKLDNGDRSDFEEIRSGLRDQGIEWHWLPYHKRFSVAATGWDILRGAIRIRSLIRRYRPDILHARVHVPALMADLARMTSFGPRPKLLFDIRGFFPEEYTDAGVWKENGLIYRAAKAVERRLLRSSDGFVLLTEKAREILFPESRETGTDRFGRPVEVIPCCVDLARFSGDHRTGELPDLSDRFAAAYIGSFGGWYMTDEMIDFFSEVKEVHPDAFTLILTQRNKESIEGRLRERGFREGDYLVDSVRPESIPAYLREVNVALSFIKACYSKQSSSPTKIAEYLASGVPIVANKGVGDVDAILEGEEVGVLIDKFSPEAYAYALESLGRLSANGDLKERCRRVARSHFDLAAVGGTKYRSIYRRLLEKKEK